MSILVTGGAGFIGSHFIELLLKETASEIVCLDNFNDYYAPSRKRANVAHFISNPRVRLIEADICDAPRLHEIFAQRRIESVVHFAAYAGVRASVVNPFVFEATNVGGTLALLEAARQHPVKRFVLASSSTVYGADVGIPFQEDAPLGIPMSPYGSTKRAAELLALTYHKLHGVPVVCLRPFSVYGPRLRPDLAMMIFAEAILRGEPIPLFGDGSFRRDFTHVSDVCAGFFAALFAGNAVGQCINVGHSEPVEMRELIDMMAAALGRPAKIDYRPLRCEDLPLTFADLSKAQRLLSYSPRVSLAAGVREFCDWFRMKVDGY